MAQQEVLALIATATDQASGPPRNLARTLQEVKRSGGDLGANAPILAKIEKTIRRARKGDAGFAALAIKSLRNWCVYS